MKSGVAIAMVMFKELARSECVNAMFAGSVDEEGNSAGAFALLDSGVSGDICIIPEPSGGKVMMGCRGRVVFEANVRGTSAHGSRPGEGVNAINEAARFVTELENIPLLMHPQLGPGSVCVLEMSGGTRTLSVPDTCWLKVDRHYVPGETKESMLGDMLSVAGRLGSEAEFEISLWRQRPTPFLEPFITENEGLVDLFTKAVGEDFTYGKSVGDYNAFAKVMPTVVYGPVGANWHSPDEHVSISSIARCLDGYRRFAGSIADNKPFIAPRH
jgi:succinyl-diaminopimelate desuccinylase